MGLPFACKWGLVADWVVLKDPFLRVSILQLGSRCLTLVMGGPAHWLNKLAQERRLACGSETAFTDWLTCLFVTCTWWGGFESTYTYYWDLPAEGHAGMLITLSLGPCGTADVCDHCTTSFPAPCLCAVCVLFYLTSACACASVMHLWPRGDDVNVLCSLHCSVSDCNAWISMACALLMCV